MYSCAALPSAARPAPDLRSSPPGDADPVHKDEWVEDPVPSGAEPFASDVPHPAAVLPLIAGYASAARERFRRELLGTAQSMLTSSVAPGAVRANEAALQAAVPRTVEKLGTPALLMADRSTFSALLGSVVMRGPNSPAPMVSVVMS